MIIFEIAWFLIKLWFLIFIYVGAAVGFLIAFSLGISLMLFGWELLRDRWNRPTVRKPRNVLAQWEKIDEEDE